MPKASNHTTGDNIHVDTLLDRLEGCLDIMDSDGDGELMEHYIGRFQRDRARKVVQDFIDRRNSGKAV